MILVTGELSPSISDHHKELLDILMSCIFDDESDIMRLSKFEACSDVFGRSDIDGIIDIIS